ncbi:MAG: hypothetical protein C0418_02980 [Coriobacteriaceae bacterium]|nr:hypothetical protein [Coriobacteriaceae bacterium]
MSVRLLTAPAIEVAPGRVEARVSCDVARMRTTDVSGLSGRALEALPGLARHTCDNGLDLPVAEELGDTEVVHLLEHVAIELLLRGAPAKDMRGGTRWDFERDGRGAFRLLLEHPDDLATLAALKCALALVEVWATGGTGDVEGAIAEVRRVRRS